MSPRCRDILNAFLGAPRRELTTAQLCEVGGSRFGARIHELERKHGCIFRAKRLRQSSWLYTLLSSPSEVAGEPVPAGDPGGSPLPSGGRDSALAGVPAPGDVGEELSLFPMRELVPHDQEAAA